jgi:acyl carrier protein
MPIRREQVVADAISLLAQHREEWEYSGEVTEDTLLFGELGLTSLDAVVLVALTEERYGRKLPFPQFYAEMVEKGARDLSVGEWVSFVFRHVGATGNAGADA